MGFHRNRLDEPAKNFDFFWIFGLARPPRTPPKGPSGLPKGSFLELNQNQGYGVSSESSQPARQNSKFLNLFQYWTSPAPQDPLEGGYCNKTNGIRPKMLKNDRLEQDQWNRAN